MRLSPLRASRSFPPHLIDPLTQGVISTPGGNLIHDTNVPIAAVPNLKLCGWNGARRGERLFARIDPKGSMVRPGSRGDSCLDAALLQASRSKACWNANEGVLFRGPLTGTKRKTYTRAEPYPA